MSAPQYMKDEPKRVPSAIVVSSEIFTSYVFKITSNEKQFPKSLRYSLIQQFQNACVNLCKHVYDGCNKKPITKQDFKRVKKAQNHVYDDLADIKAIIAIANSNAHLSNYRELSEKYVVLLDNYQKWLRNTARAKSKSKHMGTYKKKNRMDRFKANHLAKLAREMEHDDDGFAVLKKREIITADEA